ncbi:hypothetical protein B0H13DRAFT_2272292 [Mycena leptocephala]|nr:hypothetical protein B0H13DRAFT_2272292 [Mycena leptocephala]
MTRWSLVICLPFVFSPQLNSAPTGANCTQSVFSREFLRRPVAGWFHFKQAIKIQFCSSHHFPDQVLRISFNPFHAPMTDFIVRGFSPSIAAAWSCGDELCCVETAEGAINGFSSIQWNLAFILPFSSSHEGGGIGTSVKLRVEREREFERAPMPCQKYAENDVRLDDRGNGLQLLEVTRNADVGTRQDVVQRLNQFSFGHKVEKQQSNHECKSHQPFQNRKQSWAFSLPALPYTPPLPTASSNVKSTSLAHPAPAPAHTTYVSPSPLKARRAKATRGWHLRSATRHCIHWGKKKKTLRMQQDIGRALNDTKLFTVLVGEPKEHRGTYDENK